MDLLPSQDVFARGRRRIVPLLLNESVRHGNRMPAQNQQALRLRIGPERWATPMNATRTGLGRWLQALIGSVLLLPAVVGLRAVEPADDCFRNLPAGCFLVQSAPTTPAATAAIGRRLGASLVRLTNSVLSIHGAQIQVNLLDAQGEEEATRLLQIIAQKKASPAFCLRRGARVIEFVGNDAALATKASYELGLVAKPKQIHYRLVAEVATVEQADYMSLNRLFNVLLAATKSPSDQKLAAQAEELSRGFQFGDRLVLRSAGDGRGSPGYRFVPAPPDAAGTESGGVVTYAFGQEPRSHGIPFVTLTATITADETGFTPARRSTAAALLAATEFWPADDPDIVALANEITAGARTPGEKTAALLTWLAPGTNIQFGGITGSRWGVKKVLQQRFGQCWDFSDCFVTLCRAARIPCRQVAGWLFGGSGHVWAEVLVEGRGWQQVDSTGGGKLPCGIYHLAYFTTETGAMPILYLSPPRIEILNTE
jgi:hypothetical protein